MAENSSPSSSLSKGWRFLRLLARPAIARKIGTLVTEGYLAETGWVRSVAQSLPVDSAGHAVPWATLPYIDFIQPRLRPEWSVFEYGAGASTLFYAERVRRVVAVEHDEAFAERLRAKLPPHTTVFVHAARSEAYAGALPVEPGFDLVSVDGRDRVRCIAAALPRLTPRSVLVLDDAERTEYAAAGAALAQAGYRSVEFWGLPPGGLRRKCTTIFYRDGNVLGL